MAQQLVLPLYAIQAKPGDIPDVTSVKAHHFSVGSILGDGYVNKRDLCLEMESKSVTYSLWKRDLATSLGLISIHAQSYSKWRGKLGGLVAKLPLTVKQHAVNMKAKTISTKDYHRNFAFNTRSVYHDPRWREFFYAPVMGNKKKNFRKRIPDNIQELFWSDLALTIWYLDDGTFDVDKKTIRVASGEWTMDECIKMQDCLIQNFNVETRIYTTRCIPQHFFVEPRSYVEMKRRMMPTVEELLKAYPKAMYSTGLDKKLRILYY